MMGRTSIGTRLALAGVVCALAVATLVYFPGNAGAQEPTARPTPTLAPAWTATPTETLTPTITPTPTETGTPTLTPTVTPTFTSTPTQTGTPTLRPVTPISTVDRWKYPPPQPTPGNPGSVSGTPEILPVVGHNGASVETGGWARAGGLLVVVVGGGLAAFRIRIRGDAHQDKTF